MADGTGKPQTLQQEQRTAVRRRILTAARRAIAEHGLDVTVDEIATVAGVGRRTVFRYFVTRELLLNEALEDWVGTLKNRLPMNPQVGQSPQAWLVDVATGVLGTNLDLGNFYWEIHGPRSKLAQVNRQVYDVVRSLRIVRAAEVCANAWTMFGGTGEPPAWAIDMFAVQLSVFVPAFLGELDRTRDQIIRAVAASLEAVIRLALSETSGDRRV
ncbi:MAG: Transcriptional regulator, TetR family [Ilumatobacteraceae bacterium]|nr:Transcriptional regulator, TetR family [Ilumatobacteraceae bacterium]